LKALIEELLKEGLITEAQLEEAEIKQIGAKKPLQDLLVEMGFIKEEDLIKVLSNMFHMPIAKLDPASIDPSVIELIPYDVAKRHGIFPLRKEDNTLFLAMSDPVDVVAVDEIKAQINMEVEPLLATKSDIETCIEKYYNSHDILYDLFKNIIMEEAKMIPQGRKDGSMKSQEVTEYGPVTRMMNFLLSDAISARASDVHIEPQEHIVRIRYRVDGDLKDVIELPRQLLSPIVARIKVMSNLDLAEERKPQDGRTSIFVQGRKIDVRVSVLPTYYGEKVVLRILDNNQAKIQLEKLGLDDNQLGLIKNFCMKPQGIILVTGPTGSGKTSTLYAAINFIKSETKNIITIEDPIEYLIEGVTQIQINPIKNLTFASGLRSILRQDPNVILVGEIRDKETAEISFRAALTGHLVLSSLHTTGAIASITRLLDIGLEPYFISSSLIVIVAQRLAKCICSYCKESYTPPEEIVTKVKPYLDKLVIDKFYRGRGCEKCLFSGYFDRIGIFEILPITEEIKRLIANRASEEDIFKAAQKEGFKTLIEDGLEKVTRGLTTLEEVVKVVDIAEKLEPPLSKEERKVPKILVADDEEHIQRILEVRLKSAGYEVIKASNGKEAVALVMREKPDLIIMDIMMPEMDGFQATKILKSRLETALIPIMMLTAKKDVDSELKGIDMGADDYMTKPFDGQRLLARIKMLLRRKINP